MSPRNLGQTSCARCGKDRVIKLVEKPRPITVEETGRLFPEYEGLIVAHACCWVCGARYLAWVDERDRLRPGHYFKGERTLRHAEPVSLLDPGGYFDLSYRSTFDNEARDEDLPPYDPDAVEPLVTEALFLIERARKTALADPDRWVRARQLNNLAVAEYELLGAWDCRNDHPRHGDKVERSKTEKYSGTGAKFDVTYWTKGDLWMSESDRDEFETWWTTDMPEEVVIQRIGAYVLRILKLKLERLRAEGRLY